MTENLIEWKDDYKLGIPSIDSQHMTLIEMIANVQKSLLEGTSTQLLQGLIIQMVDYTSYHLSYEENFFTKLDYKDREMHLLEHKLFRDKAVKFKATIESEKSTEEEKISTALDIKNFLTSWFVGHVMESDKQYQQLFIEHGVK